MYFEAECVMALQGHPRSLILTPIESKNAAHWCCYAAAERESIQVEF